MQIKAKVASPDCYDRNIFQKFELFEDDSYQNFKMYKKSYC